MALRGPTAVRVAPTLAEVIHATRAGTADTALRVAHQAGMREDSRVRLQVPHDMGHVLVRHTYALVAAVLVVGCVSRSPQRTMPNGLRVTVLAAGTGSTARPGQQVTIHETTTLPSGGLIYTSRGGTPITFRLGANQVITGVDEGVTGMRVGERRLLVVPPALSRRASYPANTPPDSTLHIDVELLAIRPP